MAIALVVLIAVSFVLGLRKLTTTRRPRGARRLPGPRGFPYVGRVHDLPKRSIWLKFWEWSKQYGPIYQMEIFGTMHIWISSEEVACDLLSRRASVYSDRPLIPNLPNNRTSGEYLALLGRSETWNRQRKLCNHLMHASARQALHSYPTAERDRFLYLMSLDPANYIEWVEQYTSRTVSWLCWGTPRPSQILRHTTFGLLETISPSGSLPNIVSVLRYLPAAVSPWKKKERARHALEERLFRANLAFVVGGFGDSRQLPSFQRTFLEATKAGADERGRARWGALDEAMRVVGLMAIAGALTIGSPVQSYLLAMCHYPAWQRLLQAEIDVVLGGRCPAWEDRARLPLLRAVVKEVIRWRPPVPTGIPHASEEEDVYRGYHIPAGATVHALEWGITRDEQRYPDAEAFNPRRWLDPAFPTYRAPLAQYPNLSGHSQFGFGRRTCQGIPVVEQDLFLTMGGLAWAFDVRRRRDPATGAELHVHWDDYTPLLIAKPVRFPFDALPRSPARLARMRDMHLAAVRAQSAATRGAAMDLAQFEPDLGGLVDRDDTTDAHAGAGAVPPPSAVPELSCSSSEMGNGRRSR